MENENNQQNPQQQSNLIAKAVQHLKTKLHGTNIYKNIACLTLATLTAFGVAFSTGCSSDPVGPDGNYICSDCGGSHKTSDHGKKDESGYTNLLKSAMENEEYQQIIEQASKNDYKRESDLYLLNQHPYGFLKDQGYDIEKIKNGELSCVTFSFVLDDQPTTLYMVTHVESGTYWGNPAHTAYGYVTTNYIISYKLSKDEIEEYVKACDQGFVYSFFLNDVISRQKQPTIHFTSQNTRGVQTELYESAHEFNLINSIKNHYAESLVLGVDNDKQTLEVLAINKGKDCLEIGTMIDTRSEEPELYYKEGLLSGYSTRGFSQTFNVNKSYKITYVNNTQIDNATCDYVDRYGDSVLDTLRANTRTRWFRETYNQDWDIDDHQNNF